LTNRLRSKFDASRVAAIGGALSIIVSAAALADAPAAPASPASAAEPAPEWHSMSQDGLFSSITQNLRESEQEVVRGHFDIGEPPNVHRYYCLVNPRTGRREPNGVSGQPVPRPDGMTGIKIDAVSLYTCAKAEQKGFLVTAGYVLNGPALARAAARPAAAAPSPAPAAAESAATTPAATPAAANPAAAAEPARPTVRAAPARPPAVRMSADRIDVAGVKLGMSPDAVRTVLKSKGLRHYKEWTETLSFLNSNGTSQPVPNGRFVNVIAAWTPAASGTPDDLESEGESFEVMFTPVPGEERAMAIIHTQGFSRQDAIRETALDEGLVRKYGGYADAGALPDSVTWRFQADGSVQVGDACGGRGTFGGLGGLSVANAPRENLALRRTPQELQSQVERCGDATVTADRFTPNGGALPSDRLVTRFTVTAFSPALGLEGARKAAQRVQAAGPSSEARSKDTKAPDL